LCIINYLVKKWYLGTEKDEPNKDWHLHPTGLWLDNLSKINIFVGPNNSGKSRFLRYLLSLENEKIRHTALDQDEILNTIDKIRNDIQNVYGYSRDYLNRKYPEIFDDQFIPKPYLSANDRFSINLNTFLSGLQRITNNSALKILLGSYKHQLEQLIADCPEDLKFYKIYIPVLRGLRPSPGDPDGYKTRTIQDYFTHVKISKFEIYTGIGMYIIVKELANGDHSERELKQDYEKFLSREFFENQPVVLTANIRSDILHVKIGNEKEFPISQLGDGIQQLIILTFPLFIKKQENVLAFIEEPENYLHPGLQRKMIELLSSSTFGNLQTYITTHSNHLLDLTLDFDNISIFRFKKTIEDKSSKEATAKFEISNSNCEDFRLLEELGVRNSSVFLTNCTIWVEGITDRIYIRKYLDIFQKSNQGCVQFEEDRHYSFIEYSGSNITHWSFLDEGNAIKVESLCGKLFLITDKDCGKEKRHEILKSKLGDRYYCLQCREIENLLPPSVLKNIIEEYEGSKLEFFGALELKQYKDKLLGEYIDNLPEKLSKKALGSKNSTLGQISKLKRKYASESGTLKNKVDFAKKATKYINEQNDMSEEAWQLAEKIYSFIAKSNGVKFDTVNSSPRSRAT